MTEFTNLGDLIRRDRDPDKLAIVDLGGGAAREFTYRQLDILACGVARDRPPRWPLVAIERI